MRFCVALAVAVSAVSAAELVILEKVSGHAGFYTPEGKLKAEVPIGGHPHEMAVSPDGRFGYTSDNGVLWMTEAGPGTNTVTILDLKAKRKVGVVDLGKFRRPHGIDYSNERNQVFVTTELPSALLIIDPKKQAVIENFEVGGKAPHMVVADGNQAWVSCTDTSNISVIDLKTHKVESIPVGPRPQGLNFSPDRKRLYVSNGDGHTITVIDPIAKKAVGEIPLGSAHSGPVRLAISLDGKTILAALQLDKAIAIASLETMKEEKILPLPGPPVSMSLSKDGKFAYCSVQDLDTVFVVSLARREIVATFKTPKGAGPDPVRSM